MHFESKSLFPLKRPIQPQLEGDLFFDKKATPDLIIIIYLLFPPKRPNMPREDSWISRGVPSTVVPACITRFLKVRNVLSNYFSNFPERVSDWLDPFLFVMDYRIWRGILINFGCTNRTQTHGIINCYLTLSGDNDPFCSLLGPGLLGLHRPCPATCCRRSVPGGGWGKLIRSKDAVTCVHLEKTKQWVQHKSLKTLHTRMSSRPVLSSHPLKVELLDSLASKKIMIKYNNRHREEMEKMNRWWEKDIHHKMYFFTILIIILSLIIC